MTGRILVFDDSGHRHADALLPWFANGTLDPEEHAAVERHVQACSRCTRELEQLLELRTLCSADEPTCDAASAYAPLRARLDRRTVRDRVLASLRCAGRLWHGAPTWTRWGLAAELVAICVLASALALPEPAPNDAYRTLGSSLPHPAGNIVVRFGDGVPVADVQRTLRAAHARIVDGPTATNAYVLQVATGSERAAVALLRGASGVVLAEPLTQPSR